MKQTESDRLMRGAWEAYYEYIPELHTEFIAIPRQEIKMIPREEYIPEEGNPQSFWLGSKSAIIVGCDVVAHVINA